MRRGEGEGRGGGILLPGCREKACQSMVSALSNRRQEAVQVVCIIIRIGIVMVR